MTLHSQLDAAARWDAEYRGSLASHLPMALIALARLGAAEQRLAAFAARYAKRLHPAPPPEPWPSGQPWQGGFGNPGSWPAYRSLFNDWLNHEGAPSVLAQALPPLMRGVGAAAFHGLIRTAYAVAGAHANELADALAYWSCRWFMLGELPAQDPIGDERDPARLLARLAAVKPRTRLIADGMVIAAQQRNFAACAAALRIDDADETLEALATLAARAYAASANFTVLHLVTSAHALRVLLPWIDGEHRPSALRHYWQAYAAGHAASGLVERRAGRAAPLPWHSIISAAIASDDDHFIKLVDSCCEQERAYGGSVWRDAASHGAPCLVSRVSRLRRLRHPHHPQAPA
jgi:Questin oxidase-like